MPRVRARQKWIMPTDEEGRPIVDAYLRMSDGFDGKEDNRENQLADIMPLYERNNWALGLVLQDEVSAWKRGVTRDDFEKLLRRIEGGESAGAAFYNQDRFLRRPSDLERFLSLWEDGRSGLIVASVYGKIDLNDPQQRAFMRTHASMAMAASDDTSRRAKRKNEGRRERGILDRRGPRAFAWDDGKVDRDRLRAEQQALKAAYVDHDQGVSMMKIVDRLNEANLLSYYGRPWTATTLRNTMSSGRYAGYIEHQGEVVGRIADHEPLIEPELWERVQLLFASRRRGRPHSGRFLASGILTCANCKATMRSRPQYKNKVPVPAYRCDQRRGCSMSIPMEHADAVLRSFTIQALSDPALAAGVSAIAAERDARITKLQGQLDAAQAAEASIMAKFVAEEISPEVWEAGHNAVFARIKNLKQELAELEVAVADTRTVQAESAEVIATKWDEAVAEGRLEDARAMLERALHQGYRVEVQSSGARYPTDPNRRAPEERLNFIPIAKR